MAAPTRYQFFRGAGIVGAAIVVCSLLHCSPTPPAISEEALETFPHYLQEQLKGPQPGRVLLAYELFDLAIPQLEFAVGRSPDSLADRYYLGVAQAGAGLHAEAAQTFQEALRIDPAYVGAHIRLGESLLRAEMPEEAAAAFRSALLSESDVIPALAYYGLGRALVAMGKPAEAIDALERASADHPGFGAAHYALATAYREVGETEKSRRQFELHQQNPAQAPAMADPLWSEMDALNVSPTASLRRAESFVAANQLAEASAEYEQALEKDPDLTEAHVSLISVYRGRKDLASAEIHARRALELDPNSPKTYLNIGLLRFTEGLYEEAAAAYEKSVELDPHFAETRVQLAFTLEKLGRPGNVEQLRLALEDDPQHRQANYLFGKHLAETGRTRQAIAYLRKAVTPEDEKSPWFYHSLSVALRQLGERDESLAAANRGLDLALQNGVRDAVGPLRQLQDDLR